MKSSGTLILNYYDPLPESLNTFLNSGSPPPDHQERPTVMTRHGSIGGEDPGVISPMVWQLHKNNLAEKNDSKLDINVASTSTDTEDVDISQVRKRFDQLLDEALTFYDDGFPYEKRSVEIDIKSAHEEMVNCTPKMRPNHLVRNFDRRIHSALDSRERSHIAPTRPQTSIWGGELRKNPNQNISNYTSGNSNGGRLQSRPLSAGPFHRPVIQTDFIFSDSQLSVDDPAVSVISAIKQELDKIPEYEPSDISKLRPSTSRGHGYHNREFFD